MNRFLTIPAAAFTAAAFFVLASFAEPDVNDKAPTLSVKALDGRKFDLSAELKKGPVFVNFWATWCPPCKEEFPLVSQLAGKWQPKGVRFISVAIKDRPKLVSEFVKKLRPKQAVALDTADKVYKAWDLRMVPVSFLVGKNGKIVGYYDQFDKQDLPAIEKEIEKATQKSKSESRK